jgi:hypothetical protein
MANILVLTGYTDNMAEVGDRCAASQRAYAERRGYKHETVRTYHDRTHPSHQKLEFITERIGSYDGIMWMDADSYVTGDMDLEPLRYGQQVMDISIDWCAPMPDDLTSTYVSAGNFIVWNKPSTVFFLDIWRSHSERFAVRQVCCWEQDGLRSAMNAIPTFNGRVRRHPRRTFNAVHHTCVNRNFPDSAPMPWQPGDFILHLTNVDRVAILNSL